MPYNSLSVCKDTMLVIKSSMSKLFDEVTHVIVNGNTLVEWAQYLFHNFRGNHIVWNDIFMYI